MFQGSEETVELELHLRVAGFSIVESDGPKTARVTFLVFSNLKEDVSNSIGTRVDSQDHRTFGLVVQREESRGIGDSDLQILESFQLSRPDLEGLVFSGKLDESTSDQGIIFDENLKNTASSEKSPNFRNSRWEWPLLDCFYP